MTKSHLASYLSHLLIFLLFLSACKTKPVESSLETYDSIPLPEHPRPDWQRKDWVNLNGLWNFEFDSANQGEKENWFNEQKTFSKQILVPFPWGSKLSRAENEANIAWYQKPLEIPEDWKGKRIFLVVGASDWLTTGWLNGNKVGSYQGGYTPFEFDLTEHIKFGENQNLVLKVDDSPHDFKLFGKQGYGDAKGIWQTIYLEARTPVALDYIHFSPDIDKQNVKVEAMINQPHTRDLELILSIKTPENLELKQTIPKGQNKITFTVPIPNPRLWSPDDPFLYETTATLSDREGNDDEVSTYFGMRKISVMNLPGTDIPYIALNNKPIYVQLTLDQSYHPEGFYTFPSDQFMKDEILRTKNIGLNGQRIHIKVEHPRKLYWADKLGVLIMADVPNSWGEPDEKMRKETIVALKGMIKRDYNHPSIFSWINFNETWGLFTNEKGGKKVYKEETQKWVADVYRLTKSLDSTRLVEDNSPCNYDHVVTDINSWHSYLPGYKWKATLDDFSNKTFPGSQWNFVKGYKQGNQPNINSECGNVWGYEGSTGDVDWSWDYHIMINEFRSHPKIAGWLYTEHHDVINEWNGYYKYDRSEKFTGIDSIFPGMKLNDLHSLVYLAPQLPLAQKVEPGAEVKVPLWLSVMTDQYKDVNANIESELILYDQLGNRNIFEKKEFKTTIINPWISKIIEPLAIKMPSKEGLAILRLLLKDDKGKTLHRNFTTFIVGDGKSSRDEVIADGKNVRVLRFSPASFTKADWSQKQWNILNGLKANGAGNGYFEYEVNLPKDLNLGKVKTVTFQLEASSKQLLGKDKGEQDSVDEDYMRGAGLHDPGKNPNAYPMTDVALFSSEVEVVVNGKTIETFPLKDDPADHRGILSWSSQPKNKFLYEAGTYGYLLKVDIPLDVLKASADGKIKIRLQVPKTSQGGLAIYGEEFGRYPIDPMLIFYND